MVSIEDIIYYRKLKNEMFNNYKDSVVFNNNYEEMNEIWSKEELKKLHSIDTSHYKKVARLRKNINKLLSNYNCIFLTLTFNNENYSENYEILRNKLNLFLRKLRKRNIKFIGNFDTGAINGRGHFHFIINNEIDYSLWTYGAINGKRIINKSDIKLSRYINKLSNHCVKDSTKFRIIRSKNI